MFRRRAFLGFLAALPVVGIPLFAGPLRRRLTAAGGDLTIRGETIRWNEELKMLDERLEIENCTLDFTGRNGRLWIEAAGGSTIKMRGCVCHVDQADMAEWRALCPNSTFVDSAGVSRYTASRLMGTA